MSLRVWTDGRVDYAVSRFFDPFILSWYWAGGSPFTLGRLAALTGGLLIAYSEWKLGPWFFAAFGVIIGMVLCARVERYERNALHPSLAMLRAARSHRMFSLFVAGCASLFSIEYSFEWVFSLGWVLLALADYCCTTSGGTGKNLIDRIRSLFPTFQGVTT